jgi:opacity protein-like surface antigen
VKVTDNISVFAEYRYQNSFAPIDIDGDAYVANSAVLGGLKFKF